MAEPVAWMLVVIGLMVGADLIRWRWMTSDHASLTSYRSMMRSASVSNYFLRFPRDCTPPFPRQDHTSESLAEPSSTS